MRLDPEHVKRTLDERRMPEVAFWKVEYELDWDGDEDALRLVAVLEDRQPERNFRSPEVRRALESIERTAEGIVRTLAGDPELSIRFSIQTVSEQQYLEDLRRQDEREARALRLEDIERLRKKLDEEEAALLAGGRG